MDQGIENLGRFTPVFVTGEMSVKAAKRNLFPVDGSSDIDVGYVLGAGEIEPYKK